MSVFILGATGFIGGAVASLFEEKGWKVYALARTEEKAKELRKKEIIPVIAAAKDTQIWYDNFYSIFDVREPIARSADVLIDAVGDWTDHTTTPTITAVLTKIITENKTKISYGDTKDEVVDENSPSHPKAPFAPRSGIEKQIMDAGGIVLRPGFVFGRTGSITGQWIGSLLKGEAIFPGPGNQVISFVHVADLAELYYLVALRGNEFRGHLFNATHTIHVFRDALQALAKATGFTGEFKFVPAQDVLSDAMSVNCAVSSNKAKTLLGWNPKRDFIASAKALVEAFKAYN